MLIIMEYRDVHALAQFLLNVETFWRFNIFEVDTTKSGFQGGNNVDQFVWIQLIHFNVKHINARKLLKQNTLAFHHRFTGQRTNVAQS
ncbi:hypothetical protein D3C79_1042940 [compost metagenome]